MSAKRLSGLLLTPVLLLLGGCDLVLLQPDGFVARQQSDIMIITTIIFCLIIVPVLIAIGVVGWRYRASNKKARYDAEWDHSIHLELLVWAAPLLIIIAVGAITWIGTHQLDPYHRLGQIDENTHVAADVEPLEVKVVSLRWKWLFFYPQYGIATVNELAAPVDVPIHFKLTSEAMMDSFFVPTLAGMIYTMPGMQTKLNAVINEPGVYKGFSANYSGHGFTDMRFAFLGMSQQDFSQWVAKVRGSDDFLDRAAYLKLAEPGRDAPVSYYDGFTEDLYWRIFNRCVNPEKTCMSALMAGHDHASDPSSLADSGEHGHAETGHAGHRSAELPHSSPDTAPGAAGH